MRSMRSKANRRSSRAIVQFILGGGLTGLLAIMAEGLSSRLTALVLATGTLAFIWVQNYAEDHGIIPVIFPAPPPDDPQA